MPTSNLEDSSFDMDAIDPAYMPGTGTPEPARLTTREAFPIMRRLCAESNVVSVDIFGIAVRKEGITEQDYLSPLTTDDGRK